MNPARVHALRGVTLIEMMVVVAIVGIVAAIAIPNLAPVVRHQRLQGKAEEVASIIDRARRLAYAKGRCMRVSVPDNKTVRLEQPDTTVANSQGNNCVQRTGPGVFANPLTGMNWKRVSQFPGEGDVTFTLEDVNSGTEIIMRPNGRLRGDGDIQTEEDGARIRVHSTRNNEGYLVKVTPFGRICKVHYKGTPPAQGSLETCP